MKKIIIALVTIFTLAGSYKAESQINDGINFNTFYTQLSPYGRWVNNADYGQVWIANANGFEPYSNDGHWEFTDYGWTWVSDYVWGWAPFHYGRWANIPGFGWAWVPGYEWAPAWVSWCQYDGYYGWAPLSPGLGFNSGFGSIPYNHWRFVQYQYINSPKVYHHYSRPVINTTVYNNVTIINNTKVNNNITYAAGPAQQDVEAITRKKIQPKQVAFTEEQAKKTEVVKNQVRIFRPGTKANAAQALQPAATVKQPVKQAPLQETEQGAAVQPAQTVKPGIIAPKKEEPVTKQPEAVKNNDQQAEAVRQQQLQQAKNRENEAAQQQNIRKEQEVKQNQQQADSKQQQDAERMQQLKDQQAAQQRDQQNQLRQQQEADRQQQIKEQQATQQKAQQDELRREQQQNQLRKQQQQEQLRQQKMQQQQMRKAEREQKAFPQQQAAPAKEQPVRSGKKDRR